MLTQRFASHPDRRLVAGYVLVVACAVVAILGAVLPIAMGRVAHVDALQVVGFAGLATFASWFMPRLRIGGSRHGQSMSEAAIIFGLMVLPNAWVIVSIAIGTALGKIGARFPPARVVFNTAKEVVTVAIAAAVGMLCDLTSPFPTTAETFGRIVLVALIAIAADEAISVPAISIATGQRPGVIWSSYAAVRLLMAAVRMGCGIAAGYLVHSDARLAIAVPLIAIALHLAYSNRLQQRVDRIAWARLSQLVDAMSAGDAQTIRLAAVHGTAELFACADVDLVLPDRTGTDVLIRGDARTITYVGPASLAPERPGTVIVASLGGNGWHGNGSAGNAATGTGSAGNDVDNTATGNGTDDSLATGELRLRFLMPIKLTDQERHTMQALAAALGTAVRKANTVSAAARMADDQAHASTRDALTGLANRWFLLEQGVAAIDKRSAARGTRAVDAGPRGQADGGGDSIGDRPAAPGRDETRSAAGHEPNSATRASEPGEASPDPDRTAKPVGPVPDQRLVALAAIDLHGFKHINDALGQPVGDEVLIAVAKRLDGHAGPGDLIARLSGGEFAALLTPVESTADAAARTRELLQAIAQPLVVDGVLLNIAATAGVAVDTDRCDVGELLRRADVAIRQATLDGQPVAVYAPARDTADINRLVLGADLTRAVARREFTIAFQPVVELESGMVRSAEALARWQHPQLGQLSPHQFLDGIERSGLLAGFTEHILDQALAGARSWTDAGFEIPVAVNVSPRSLLDSSFPKQIATALDRYHLAPGSLIIELTETLILSQHDVVDEVLHTLREIGVMLALDDFGTGFSSLATVARVPVDELKIDRSFIAGLAGATENAIVRSTIELGRSLGILVVAEGIESNEQRDRLWALGCSAGQGHLFARAVPADRLIARLRRGYEGVPGRLVPPLQGGDVIRLPSGLPPHRQADGGSSLPPHRQADGGPSLPSHRQADGGSRDELS